MGLIFTDFDLLLLAFEAQVTSLGGCGPCWTHTTSKAVKIKDF